MAYKAFTKPLTGYIADGNKAIKSAPGDASATAATITNGCDVAEVDGWDMDAANNYARWYKVKGMENITGTAFEGYLAATDVKILLTTYGIQDNKGLVRVYSKEENDIKIDAANEDAKGYTRGEVKKETDARIAKDNEFEEDLFNINLIINSELRPGLNDLTVNKQDKISDSGWAWLTFGSNFDPNGTLAQYRKIGNLVEIRLSLKARITANTNDRWYLAIQDLPAAIIPSSSITTIYFNGLYNESVNVNLKMNGSQIQFKTEKIETGNYIYAHVTYIV